MQTEYQNEVWFERKFCDAALRAETGVPPFCSWEGGIPSLGHQLELAEIKLFIFWEIGCAARP